MRFLPDMSEDDIIKRCDDNPAWLSGKSWEKIMAVRVY